MNNKKRNIKYDSKTGLQQWAALLNGTGNSTDQANAIAADDNNNLYVTGYTTNAQGNEDYTTVSYSPAGQLLWLQNYDGPAQQQDYATAIAIDKDNNAYVTGASVGMEFNESDYTTVKYQQNGTLEWIQRYSVVNNSSIATSIAINVNNNIYVTGQSIILGAGGYMITVKYSSFINSEEIFVPVGSQITHNTCPTNLIQGVNKAIIQPCEESYTIKAPDESGLLNAKIVINNKLLINSKQSI